MLIVPLMAVSPNFTTRNKLQNKENWMLRVTGKKTKHLDGEGGSGGGVQLPLVTEPYRDPANEDK
jgi:hypothetical protein